MTLTFRLAAVAALLLAAACGGAKTDKSAKTEPAKAATTAAATTSSPAAGRNDIVIGKADAPVTVIEYASATCPHCAAFHETVFPQVKEQLIDTGRIKLVFRELPTPPAEFAYIGGVLGRCAAERNGADAYMMVLGTLFRNQHPQDASKSWIFGSDPRGELLKIAAQAGMDATQFEACLKRQDLVDLINANVKEAEEKYKITGTPNFLFNGKLVRIGSYEDFRKAVDEAEGKPAPAAAAPAPAPAASAAPAPAAPH